MPQPLRFVLGLTALVLLAGACGGDDAPAAPASESPPPGGPSPGSSPPADTDVEEAVSRILVEILEIPRSRVRLDARIVDDLGGDDLDLVEIVMECEDTFGVSIPDVEAFRIQTVQELVEQIEALGGQPGR